MAISFVGSGVATNTGTTNGTFLLNTGILDSSGAAVTPAVGDLIICNVVHAGTADYTGLAVPALDVSSTLPNATVNQYRNASTNDVNHQVSWGFVGAGDTTLTIPRRSATGNGTVMVVHILRGVDPTTPLDVAAVVAGLTGTGTPNPGAITPATPGAWILTFGAMAMGTGANLTNPTDASTVTNHFRSQVLTATTNDPVAATALYTSWTSGAFDPAAFGGGQSAADNSFNAFTLAFRPAPAGATGGIKAYNGSAFVTKPVKVWTGSAWVTKPLKRWNGSAWVLTP